MDLGLTLPSFVPGTDRRTILAWCRRAEDGPFTSLSVGERTAYPSHEMLTSLAFAAAATERVRLVATVAVAPIHDTVRLAKQAATIDVLSGGRFTLGVGVGGREQDYAAHGVPFRARFARLDEQVDQLRRTWRGEEIVEGVPPIGPAPVQPNGPPILTSAAGPRSLARSAQWADGVAGFDLAPDPGSVDRLFQAAKAAWQAAGRVDVPRLTTSTWFALGDGAAERLLGYGREYLATFGDTAALAMASLCRLNDPGILREALVALAETGCDEFTFVPTTADVGEVDRLVASLP